MSRDTRLVRPYYISCYEVWHRGFLLVMKRLFLCSLLALMATLSAIAQNLTGVVMDAETGEKLPFVNVFYANGARTQTDLEGRFTIARRQATLNISLIGYQTKTIKPSAENNIEVRLTSSTREFSAAVVQASKKKYSRKNNPAVELMRKVIAAKTNSDVKRHDFYSYDKYSKMVFALNDVNDKTFAQEGMSKFSFLKDHIETSSETGKRILPISVEETVSREIYRKTPHSEKSIITGKRQNGINDLINTGDILNTLLKECFTDVNIYQDEVRLLQYPFTSPISSKTAISFYRYFIEDTVMIGKDKTIHLTFTPNNPQDFGFSGDLYIMADSTYRVRRADLGIPVRSDVNYVERMNIYQDFEQLPSGEQVLTHDDMIVQLKLASFIQKLQVRRTTDYSNFSLEPIADKTFHFKGDTRTEANAMVRGVEFWNEVRPETLTKGEEDMDLLVKKLQNVKGFKFALFVAKAFIENFVETSLDPKKPSKVDIGPVNTIISQSKVEGLRLRASAQTTAFLDPHLFAKGYIAYGFRDHRWKGMGEVTYSFNKKAYLPREFPVNNLTLHYENDLMSASDQFIPTDKDNVFTSFKWTNSDHMLYNEMWRLNWDREWENGLRFNAQLRTQKTEAAGSLFYQRLNLSGPTPVRADHLPYLRTTDFTASLRFQPGATFINTKQRRIAVNNDAPIYSVSHTIGLEGVLGSQYTYNLTEAGIYKRLWLGSWGKMDFYLKGGAQWNKVPFPLLITPAANLSYIMEDNTFNLIDNMEFLNDRYASLMYGWDLNGKVFNRIPLIKKLKWREYLGVNVLWGQLTDKNNPWKNPNDGALLYFPGTFNADGSFDFLSSPMDPKKPYVEAIIGVHNIFKIFHIQYVRRLTYIDNPDTKRWGIRFMFRVTF